LRKFCPTVSVVRSSCHTTFAARDTWFDHPVES